MKHSIILVAALSVGIFSSSAIADDYRKTATTSESPILAPNDKQASVGEKIRADAIERARANAPESTRANFPDNTKINVRDRQADSVTPFEQGNSQEDRELAAKIRRELVQNDNLSSYAKNVKIVVGSGEVMLRGPVRSREEAQFVERAAEKLAGSSNRVQSQLQVAPVPSN